MPLKCFFTYPSAQVARHSPLCSCRPFTHSVQFMRETHCVQVCKHIVHTPASMKEPLSHVLTHLLFCNRRLFEHVRQSFSVGPMHDSHVEWHEWQWPLSKYSAVKNKVLLKEKLTQDKVRPSADTWENIKYSCFSFYKKVGS